MLQCVVCGGTLPPHLRDCVNGHPNDYPNVRVARSAEEFNALQERLLKVRHNASAAGTLALVQGFAQTARQAQAVMARNIKALDAFVGVPNNMLSTYYEQVRSGARIPEDNYWDMRRGVLDSVVNLHIHDRIHFAALSLSGRGPSWFGSYHVTLKDDAINDRTTVFEMNPFAFFKAYPTLMGDLVPPGFRAAWSDRHLLAEAKLGNRLKANSVEDEYPDILLDDKGGDPDADFIEVHIFGSIHLDAVARVIAQPKPGEHQIWERVKEALLPRGVIVEEF